MDFGREFLKNLVKVISCFAFYEISFEFRENFAPNSISCFPKFCENTKTKIFAATLPLPSLWTVYEYVVSVLFVFIFYFEKYLFLHLSVQLFQPQLHLYIQS